MSIGATEEDREPDWSQFLIAKWDTPGVINDKTVQAVQALVAWRDRERERETREWMDGAPGAVVPVKDFDHVPLKVRRRRGKN